jgi:hypothetical protein
MMLIRGQRDVIVDGQPFSLSLVVETDNLPLPGARWIPAPP